jgi:hypothetical protein
MLALATAVFLLLFTRSIRSAFFMDFFCGGALFLGFAGVFSAAACCGAGNGCMFPALISIGLLFSGIMDHFFM